MDFVKTNLLLTGPPGVGKTTLMAEIARQVTAKGGQCAVAGLITQEIREAGRRVGFGLQPLHGETKIMAHRGFISNCRVAGYGVDVEVINYVVDMALGKWATQEAQLFLVDEIGRMECLSARFTGAIQRLLEDPRPLVATVAEQGDGLIAKIKTREDVELWSMNQDNREDLPRLVTKWWRERSGRERLHM